MPLTVTTAAVAVTAKVYSCGYHSSSLEKEMTQLLGSIREHAERQTKIDVVYHAAPSADICRQRKEKERRRMDVTV